MLILSLVCCGNRSPARALLVGLLIGLMPVSATAQASASNRQELHQLLVGPTNRLVIRQLAREMGCTGSECVHRFESLAVSAGGTRIRFANEKAIRVPRRAQAGEVLRALHPLAAYEIKDASGRDLGACVEFTHGGTGRSGLAQRWTTIIWLPVKQTSRKERIAYRFFGYWAGCEFIDKSKSRNEIALTVIERKSSQSTRNNRSPAFEIVSYACSPVSCKRDILPSRVMIAGEGYDAILLFSPEAASPRSSLAPATLV